jgi:hypothetical protein
MEPLTHQWPHLGLSLRWHPFDIHQRCAKAHKPQFQSLFSLEPNARVNRQCCEAVLSALNDRLGTGAKERALRT